MCRYHQKVPDEVPVLKQSEETYGLVKPEEFVYPTADIGLWSSSAYLAFDITKAATPDFAVRFNYHIL
jgi:hypothetical protein